LRLIGPLQPAKGASETREYPPEDQKNHGKRPDQELECFEHGARWAWGEYHSQDIGGQYGHGNHDFSIPQHSRSLVGHKAEDHALIAEFANHRAALSTT
jgi:hypothetical protein